MYRLLKNNSHETDQTVIALLRHGQTIWNEEGRIQGRKDSPLSEKGSRQVQKWGKFIGHYTIDLIIASDLGRVRETVAIIQQVCNPVPVEWQSDLREQSWGKWEGKTFRDLKREQPEELSNQIRAGWDFRHRKEKAEKRFYNVPYRLFRILCDNIQKNEYSLSHMKELSNRLFITLQDELFCLRRKNSCKKDNCISLLIRMINYPLGRSIFSHLPWTNKNENRLLLPACTRHWTFPPQP